MSIIATRNRLQPDSIQREIPEGGALADPRYVPALDGLRAISVVMVLLTHLSGSRLFQLADLGGLGVHIFFVISGYLITTILVGYQESNCGLKAAAVHFYWRRILRLYPPLLAAILLTMALGIAQMRDNWWIHALYLSNVQIAGSGTWNGASHFWSLATEEQFYLLWFPLVLLTKGRTRVVLILCALAIGPLYRLGLAAAVIDAFAPGPGVLLFGKIDALAIGAVLALAAREPRLGLLFDFFRSGALMGAAALLLVASNFLPRLWVPQLWFPSADIFACCLVRFAVSKNIDPGLAWLTWRPVRHTGKISYGLYVYHYFVLDGARLVLDFPESGPARKLAGIAFIGISFIVAEISWRLLEAPILALKSKPVRAIGYSGKQTCSGDNEPRSPTSTAA